MTSTTNSTPVIDIDNILHEKIGKRARYIPQCVSSWLKRTVHQERVNAFLAESAHLTGVPWLQACVSYLDMQLVVQGRHNLPSPTSGQRCTFVSNHPLGGIDGIALGAILGTHYDGKIRYLVNDLLMHLPGLAPLCVPINKTGTQARNTPQLINEAFTSADQIIMFPAGLCSRKRQGSIKDLAWNKTFITKSIQTQRNVIPIHFGGNNSRFFYNLEYLCHLLRIPMNIAMLYLVDEMYKNVGKTFTVTIGKPIPWETFSNNRTPQQWAQHVRHNVYQLPTS